MKYKTTPERKNIWNAEKESGWYWKASKESLLAIQYWIHFNKCISIIQSKYFLYKNDFSLMPSAVEMKWSVSGGKVGMAAARWDSNKVVQEVIKFVLNPGLDRRDRGTTNKIFYFNEIKFYCLHCLSLSLSKWYIR